MRANAIPLLFINFLYDNAIARNVREICFSIFGGVHKRKVIGESSSVD